MNVTGETGRTNAACEHFNEHSENLQEWLKLWRRGAIHFSRCLWNMLCGAVGGDEEGAELSEPLKVELAVFVKIVCQAIQV